jgi:3-oxoacyl-[acyl-carrier protein] reductase
MTDLTGKIAVVTGGAKGIGRAVTARLAKDGAKVFAFGRTEPKEGMDITGNTEIDARIKFVSADVSDADNLKDAIDKIIKENEKIDILVNNAGITKDNLLIRMSEKDFDDVMNINLKGAFLASKFVSRYMMSKRQGRIINIGSIVGTIGNPGQANYASSKAGMIGLTKSLAKELSARNILVNLVAPGYVKTEMTDKLSDEQRKYFEENIPLKRIAEPEDIANTVSFFCSDDSAYITGQVIHVDGGLAM